LSGVLGEIHRQIVRFGYDVVFKRTRAHGLLQEYLGSERADAEKVGEIQRAGLRELVEHAYTTVPYYRRLFAELGLKPGDIDSVDDLQKLPLLERRQLQENLDDFISEAIAKSEVKYFDTSGSTGKPLVFAYDSDYWTRRTANLLRTEMMCGYKPGDRVVYIYGMDYNCPEHRSLISRAKDRLLHNVVWLDAFRLSRESMGDYARFIARFRPMMLIGFTSALTLVARGCKSLGVRYDSVRAIETVGELLTSGDRELLEDAFGGKVFDRYGAEELGVIAHECDQHTGLHVMSELNYVELVDGNGGRVPEGERGVVVVTNLANFAMPMIRYKLDDVATAVGGRCACGRSFPLIRMEGGRVSDIISTPSGKMAHGEYFTRVATVLGNILRFQAVQDARDHILLRVVPSGPFDAEAAREKLQKIFTEDLDPALRCDVEMCELSDLMAASGKYRYVISKVPAEF